MAAKLLDDEKGTTVCSLCLKKDALYTCPRCNVVYCSVECYKSEKHMECSESFYKDCFVEGLKDFNASPEDKSKIMEMLSRVENESTTLDSDDEEGEDLSERLQGLDLDKDIEKIWSQLTGKEKDEFARMVKDGRIGNIVEVWTPWWYQKMDNIQEIGPEGDVHPRQNPVPPVLADIPDMNTLLSKSKPSVDVKFNVVNVLFSFAFVARLHNGEHMDCPTESAQELLHMSCVLSDSHVCCGPGEAIQLCLKQTQEGKEELKTSHKFQLSVFEDVKKIIEGSGPKPCLDFVLSSLSEICRLLKRTRKTLAKDIKMKPESERLDSQTENLKGLKKKVFKAERKVEFLLSWSQRYGMALYGLLPEIDLELCALTSDLAEVAENKERLEQEWGGPVRPPKKQLIQELT